MLAHKPLHLFEAKSADTRISRDEPAVARLNFSLANGEGLAVEMPRYVLERLLVRAKRAIEAARRLSLEGVQPAIQRIPGTNNKRRVLDKITPPGWRAALPSGMPTQCLPQILSTTLRIRVLSLSSVDCIAIVAWP